MKTIDGDAELHCGDALSVLRTFGEGCVQCCVTSPPYWGMRDYGTATWEGGVEGCDHTAPSNQGKSGQRADRTFTANSPYRETCGKCGAQRIDSQLGLESTPEGYVAKLVEVFGEVRRVLRGDGTLWLNLGDSYSRNPAKGGNGPNGKHDYVPSYGDARRILSETRGSSDGMVGRGDRANLRNGADGLKEKDLVGIPWRVAFALQADGWYLRSDIIWHKPNPMPESVTDRPTKAHEYLFLLSKSARYFYDAEAIREPDAGLPSGNGFAGRQGGARDTLVPGGEGRESCHRPGSGRNKRSVWTVATHPYPNAHFATFPPKLIEPCILAGTKKGDVVLDPFHGAGTTGEVALGLGRKIIGIELSEEYHERHIVPRMHRAQAQISLFS